MGDKKSRPVLRLRSWWSLLALVMLLAWGTLPTTTSTRLPFGLGLQNSTDPTADRIGQDLERIEKQVREFTLDNGLKFIVMERHQAPIISFITYVNVGCVNEPVGKTRVAHYLDHLAFKGTTRIGTKYYAAEKPLLIKLDRLFVGVFSFSPPLSGCVRHDLVGRQGRITSDSCAHSGKLLFHQTSWETFQAFE